MVTWWRVFQPHADAVDRAIEREHQAVISSDQPWPPGRKPDRPLATSLTPSTLERLALRRSGARRRD